MYSEQCIGESHEHVNLKEVDENVDDETRKEEKWSSHQQIM